MGLPDELSLRFGALGCVNAALIGSLLVLSRSKALGRHRNAVTNPILFLVVFFSIFVIDFFVLSTNGHITFFEQQQQYGRELVFEAFVAFSLMFCALVLGVHIAVRIYRPASLDLHAQPAERRAAEVVLGAALLPSVVTSAFVIVAIADILSGRINRQLLFHSNPLLLVGFGLVAPALSVYLATHRAASRRSALFTLFAATLLLSTGSRSALLIVALIYSVALVEEGVRLPPWLYVPAIPAAIAFLTGFRYVFRESWRYESIGEFVEAKGGLWRIFFEGPEIGLADGFSIIYHNLQLFDRPPFESLLGILMLPVPRSLAPFKPWSASSYLTAELSPRNFSVTRSEILASGFGDLLMQFGLPLGVIILCAIAYLWARKCVEVASAGRTKAVVWMPFLIFWAYVAMRGAFFNLGTSMWPFAMVLLGFVILKRLLRSSSVGVDERLSS